jgi:hypothetical protein
MAANLMQRRVVASGCRALDGMRAGKHGRCREEPYAQSERDDKKDAGKLFMEDFLVVQLLALHEKAILRLCRSAQRLLGYRSQISDLTPFIAWYDWL